MPAITINENGFVLSGPLVAGEPAAVSVSGLALAEGAALSLTCTARFPDALLASVELTQGDGGAWGGTLDTATKQASLYFLTARADEARAVVLELVDTANRDSLARVSAPMLNSSLLPKPDKAEGTSPLMIPGLPVSVANGGTGATTAAAARASLGAMGDDATATSIKAFPTADSPTIEGWVSAIAGTIPSVISPSTSADSGFAADAKDTGDALAAKQNEISDLETIRSGAAAGATAVQPSAMPASETWTFTVDDGQGGTSTVTKQVAVYAAQGAGA